MRQLDLKFLLLLGTATETVIGWHRQSFRLYWRWKSNAAPVGRPRIDPTCQNGIFGR